MILFFLSAIIPRALGMISIQNPNDLNKTVTPLNYAYQFWIAPFFIDEKTASLVYALAYTGLWSLLLWYFYKKRLFFKV